MTSSVGNALLLFGIAVAIAVGWAGILFSGLGLAWELYLFYRAGVR